MVTPDEYGHSDECLCVAGARCYYDGGCLRCAECDLDENHPGSCDCGHKCPACKNYYSVCGHDLPFAERIKSVSVQRLWARSSH